MVVKLNFECTNKIAKYEACTSSLLFVIDLGVKHLNVFGDAALIIYQMNGKWQTKDAKLLPYQKYLTQLIAKFEEATFSHLTSDKNQFADALATLVAMTRLSLHIDLQSIQIRMHTVPTLKRK